MAEILLQAEPRSVLGKKVARLRRSGLTPANIYGHNVPSQAIQLSTPDLAHTLRIAGGTHLVQLRLAGEPSPRMVLVRRVSRKPTTDQLLHVDFYQVSMTEKTTVEVPIVLTGTSPLADLGDAIVVQQLPALAVECLPRDIPDHIEADVSPLTELHSTVKVSDLRLPAGVATNIDPSEVVATVTPVVVEAAEAAPEEAAPAAAEEAAEEASEQAAPEA